MSIQKIKIGDSYRLKSQPNYGWAKVVELCKIDGRRCAWCDWTTDKDGRIGMKKLFFITSLITNQKG